MRLLHLDFVNEVTHKGFCSAERLPNNSSEVAERIDTTPLEGLAKHSEASGEVQCFTNTCSFLAHYFMEGEKIQKNF